MWAAWEPPLFARSANESTRRPETGKGHGHIACWRIITEGQYLAVPGMRTASSCADFSRVRLGY